MAIWAEVSFDGSLAGFPQASRGWHSERCLMEFIDRHRQLAGRAPKLQRQKRSAPRSASAQTTLPNRQCQAGQREPNHEHGSPTRIRQSAMTFGPSGNFLPANQLAKAGTLARAPASTIGPSTARSRRAAAAGCRKQRHPLVQSDLARWPVWAPIPPARQDFSGRPGSIDLSARNTSGPFRLCQDSEAPPRVAGLQEN